MSLKPILLIEDDESLGATLTENLSLEGHSVDWVRDGKKGLASARLGIHSVIVLDIMLPGLNGLELLEELRRTHQTPVLIISARGTANDRISGLELRADDYLPKPFHLREFLLRVQALLRRHNVNPTENEIQVGLARFDFPSLKVHLKDGSTEILTDKEAKVLQLLVSRSGAVVHRDEILNLVWGFNAHPTPRTVDNVIVRLRKWIESNPSEPEFILSHRGVGYSLKKVETL